MLSSTSQPQISVVTPVYNGLDLFDRAGKSVLSQTFQNWELLIIDDCSTDKSFERLQWWQQQDSRIRALKTNENGGHCAKRNFGLKHARGDIICYLDNDDEFYPEYFAAIDRWKEQGDVLFFQYDLVDDSYPGTPIRTWRPDQHIDEYFTSNITRPLGVAHHRKWVEKIGGFHELPWQDGEWDFWKRLIRAGAETLFVPSKSGVHHVRTDIRQIITPTQPQRETLEANWRANRPLFGDPISPVLCQKIKTISFLSPHCALDFTNGAAVATYAGLRTLAQQGFSCKVFCGSRMDSHEEKNVEDVLRLQGLAFEATGKQIGPHQLRLLTTNSDDISATVFLGDSTCGYRENQAEATAFLAGCEDFLRENLPDVVWTYGGDPICLAIHRLAKKFDIPVLFALHNFAYNDAKAFHDVDYVVVPAEYSRRYYWEKLGVACQILPNVVNWNPAFSERRDPRYVTFINPMPHKGVHIFARIARELTRRRPDISILVTQGRSSDISLSLPELELVPLASGRMRPNGTVDPIAPSSNSPAARNLTIMPYTPDPRLFYPRVYAATKILLMPSLWEESFGLVAAEAMLNGIPVLASNRGALPDTIGKGGFVFDIPACYTPETRIVPTAEEVEPWIETIIRLWDDATFYEQACQNARKEAQRWHPDRITPIYKEFFSNIVHQPGPPLLPPTG
jgi:glycosyltransferase involved in cell wall biosynthesis